MDQKSGKKIVISLAAVAVVVVVLAALSFQGDSFHSWFIWSDAERIQGEWRFVSAMDGGNGGWAVLYGAAPVSASSLNLAIDEDQANATERRHSAEQVAYLVVGASSPDSTAPVPDPMGPGGISASRARASRDAARWRSSPSRSRR